MASWESSYLINNGWRPAPSSLHPYGWEHPKLRLPRVWTDSQDTYEAHHARIHEDCAVMLTMAVEQFVTDERQSVLQRMVDACAWMAEKFVRAQR